MQKQLFCAVCHAETTHDVAVVGNEVIATCTGLRKKLTDEAIKNQGVLDAHPATGHPIFTEEHYHPEEMVCGHAIKFAKTTEAEVLAAMDLHNASNGPRVTAEAVHAQHAEDEAFLSNLAKA